MKEIMTVDLSGLNIEKLEFTEPFHYFYLKFDGELIFPKDIGINVDDFLHDDRFKDVKTINITNLSDDDKAKFRRKYEDKIKDTSIHEESIFSRIMSIFSFSKKADGRKRSKSKRKASKSKKRMKSPRSRRRKKSKL